MIPIISVKGPCIITVSAFFAIIVWYIVSILRIKIRNMFSVMHIKHSDKIIIVF